MVSLRWPARSPCLKLKPHSKGAKSGFLTLNVEPYGGGLWHTWFDRDLSVAGRVLLRDGDSLLHKLVRPPSMFIFSQKHSAAGLHHVESMSPIPCDVCSGGTPAVGTPSLQCH